MAHITDIFIHSFNVVNSYVELRDGKKRGNDTVESFRTVFPFSTLLEKPILMLSANVSKSWDHGQRKNPQLTSQTSVSYLYPLDGNNVRTLDVLDLEH